MPTWKAMPTAEAMAAAAPTGAVAVAAKGGAAAAVAGSGQASTSTQVIKQSNTETITTGAVTNSGDGYIYIGGSQSNEAYQYNVPVNLQVKDIQVAWGNGTATGSTE